MRFIPTKVHGAMDYMTVLALLALPRLLDFSDRATTLLTGVAIMALLYTLLTRFELGALRVLPVKVHLALDFVSGLLLVAAPFLIVPGENSTARTVMIVIGVFEIGAALMTHLHSPVETNHGGSGVAGLQH
ncbi:MAG TPA: hypothetical protein VF600_14285 [Abditibacteriaceae bacterium]|jgi:hypothetical protein